MRGNNRLVMIMLIGIVATALSQRIMPTFAHDENAEAGPTKFNSLIPILNVKSVEKSIEYNLADVDALHKEYQASGADITQPPTDKPWGMREMLVKDIDGHVLRIGQPIHEH